MSTFFGTPVTLASAREYDDGSPRDVFDRWMTYGLWFGLKVYFPTAVLGAVFGEDWVRTPGVEEAEWLLRLVAALIGFIFGLMGPMFLVSTVFVSYFMLSELALGVSRVGLLYLPAVLFPQAERREWLWDVREAFAVREENAVSAWRLVWSFTSMYPSALFAAWRDRLPQRARRATEDGAARTRRLEAKDLWYAILAAAMIEPIHHIATYYLAHYGLVWPWELIWPLH